MFYATHTYTHTGIHTHTHTHTHTHRERETYIYIYIERERERERADGKVFRECLFIIEYYVNVKNSGFSLNHHLRNILAILFLIIISNKDRILLTYHLRPKKLQDHKFKIVVFFFLIIYVYTYFLLLFDKTSTHNIT